MIRMVERESTAQHFRSLIVGETPVDYDLLVSTMETEGFSICVVHDIENALDAFKQINPDLVIVNTTTPHLDSVELCRQFRALPYNDYCAILVLVENSAACQLDALYKAGANSFEIISNDIQMIVRRCRYITEAIRRYQGCSRDRFVLDRTLRMARLGSWEIDLERKIFHCSQKSAELMGHKDCNAEQTLAQFLKTVQQEKRDEVQAVIERALNKREPFEITYPVIYSDSSIHFICNKGQVLFDEVSGKEMLLGVVQDVTGQKQAEAKIRRLAFYDGLTGLSNRLYFMNRLEQEIQLAKRRCTSFALMYLDLDQFKIVNDTFGHPVGDELLKKIAQVLRRCIRASDAASRMENSGTDQMIARLGGDEFTIIVNNIREPDHVALIARRIIEEVPKPILIEGHEIQVTTSIGISMYPQDGVDPDVLLKHADTAMYKAKNSGRNNYQFYRKSLNDAVVERFVLERDIAKAIDNEEFSLVYQPMMDADGKRIVGAEALIRWEHPTRGLVSPSLFIPVAEESGQIVAINRWVVVEASRQWQELYEQGLNPGTVAVNLSGYQFAQQKVLKTITDALQKSGLAASCLEIEITENILMQDIEETAAVVAQLKDIGVQVTLDDFGTGYSSLGYLTAFQVDSIKIDRSFVMNCLKQEKNRVIIGAIVAMGHSLGIHIIAEGVETSEQFDIVHSYGADRSQGYYFSRPVESSRYAELLNQSLPIPS